MSTIQTNRLQTLAGQTMNTVLQVVHFDYTTFQSLSGADGVALDTGLVASITPRFATSRILVKVSANMSHNNNTTVCRARIIRTGPGTAFSTFASGANMTNYTTVRYSDTGQHMMPNQEIMWFDSPATTATCTYQLQIASNGGNLIVYLNGQMTWAGTWNGISHITLMEIAQ
jgi:hypothetical protein